MANGLGREERLEDTQPRRLVHADTGVNHPQQRPVVAYGWHRLDTQRAAARHRIARVDREVDEHLLHLARVDDDGRGRWREREVEGNVFAHDTLQEALDASDQLVEVDHLRRNPLPAAEREQPLGQRRRSRPA
jgi:hypothetical protein